jgi:uncharacterized protein (TIGR00645 family)
MKPTHSPCVNGNFPAPTILSTSVEQPWTRSGLALDASAQRRHTTRAMSFETRPSPPADRAPALHALSQLIFLSRWLQAPLYVGLIVAQGVYVYRFMVELWHLILKTTTIQEAEIMLMVLGLIDVVMIANLLVMVIVGGYETFVSRLNLQNHPDQPEWLSHVNAGVLKVKLAMALIGISSIHLLKTFIGAQVLYEKSGEIADKVILWQVLIHLTFVVSAVILAWIDRLIAPQKQGH